MSCHGLVRDEIETKVYRDLSFLIQYLPVYEIKWIHRGCFMWGRDKEDKEEIVWRSQQTKILNIKEVIAIAEQLICFYFDVLRLHPVCS